MICIRKTLAVVAVALALVACVTLVSENSSAEKIGDFEYALSDSTAMLIGYTGDEDIVVIPETFEYAGTTYIVEMIGNNAFSNKSITDVTIPGTVKSIGLSAFSGCKDLQYVTINGEASIGSNAFLNCSNLSFIDFRQAPSNVGNGAFILNTDGVCTVRSSTSDIIEMIKTPNDKTQFKQIDADQYIVKFVTNGAPSSVGKIDFDLITSEYEPSVPSEALATGYDITMYDGEAPIDDSYVIPVGKDLVITLSYDYHQYTVDFTVDDKVVQTNQQDYKSTIVAPADPVKDPDAQYIYKFSHWANAVEGQPDYVAGMTLDEDHDYHFVAVFSTTLQEYTVQFQSDGKIIQSTVMKYGDVIVPPEDPEKTTEEGIDYRFSGWAGYTSGMTVTGNVIFDALFVKSDHEYTIKFLVDGEVVDEQKLLYEDPIVPPEDPVKETANGIQYTFAGWEGFTPGMTVTDDASFNALFDETPVDEGTDWTMWAVVAVVIIAILIAVFIFFKRFR